MNHSIFRQGKQGRRDLKAVGGALFCQLKLTELIYNYRNEVTRPQRSNAPIALAGAISPQRSNDPIALAGAISPQRSNDPIAPNRGYFTSEVK